MYFLMSTLLLLHGNVTAHTAESEVKELDGTLLLRIISKASLRCELLDEIISQFNPWLCILPLFTSINNIKKYEHLHRLHRGFQR